ncbi:MAG: glycosyltransferase family 2 protein [Actinomycetota bacterium]|nr:glycosyltransferase family 2 protein [Actinomycetota bacterium]
MKLSVIIPAHNEEPTVEEATRRALDVDLEDTERELIIVNDGSTDSTREKLKSFEGMENVIILDHPVNKGKGAAIRTALSYVSGDIVVIQDADLEYDPRDFPALIAPIISGEADVVYGSRFRGKAENMALANFIANKILAWLTTLLFFKRVTDEATCYKAFRTEVLKSFDIKSNGFEFCPEVTAKTLRGGYRYKEVPISYHARTVEAGKKITARDGLKAVWTLLRYRIFRK